MNFQQSTVLVILLIIYSLRKKSLSISGCIGAIFVGYATFLNYYLLTTLILLGFFITSSALTKFKSSIKSTYEEGHITDGQRDIFQVLCNGLTGSIFSILLFYNTFLNEKVNSLNYCFIKPTWTSFFLFGFIGHYACCCADTWASELGILNSDWPYSIITFKQVPPGTNGGISLLGTLASLMGGQFIGLIAALAFRYQYPNCDFHMSWIGLGMMAGLFGSLLDSWLGAKFQATYYCKKKLKILTKYQPKKDDDQDKSVEIISGSDILSNNQVNFISSLVTALFTAVIGNFILSF